MLSLECVGPGASWVWLVKVVTTAVRGWEQVKAVAPVWWRTAIPTITALSDEFTDPEIKYLHTESEASVIIVGDFMFTDKSSPLLLAELVEEDLGIDRAFPWFFHALEEEKHGRSQGLWTGQRYGQWTLEYKDYK